MYAVIGIASEHQQGLLLYSMLIVMILGCVSHILRVLPYSGLPVRLLIVVLLDSNIYALSQLSKLLPLSQQMFTVFDVA